MLGIALMFDQDAGAFGFFARVFFFNLVERAEALGFEAAFGKRWFAGAGIVESDEEHADFSFFTLQADAYRHFANDVDDARFRKRNVKFFDAERKFVIDANDFGANRHVGEKIYGGVNLARERKLRE